MNRTFRKRVVRLESRFLSVPAGHEPTAEEIRFQQTFAALLEKMDLEHADHIRIDVAEYGGKSNLTFAAGAVTLLHLRDGVPLELPACAAEAYLGDPTATPDYRCRECGFSSPTSHGKKDPPRPTVSYLKVCPLCGGDIAGSWAFRYNQSRRAELAKAQPGAPLEN